MKRYFIPRRLTLPCNPPIYRWFNWKFDKLVLHDILAGVFTLIVIVALAAASGLLDFVWGGN